MLIFVSRVINAANEKLSILFVYIYAEQKCWYLQNFACSPPVPQEVCILWREEHPGMLRKRFSTQPFTNGTWEALPYIK